MSIDNYAVRNMQFMHAHLTSDTTFVYLRTYRVRRRATDFGDWGRRFEWTFDPRGLPNASWFDAVLGALLPDPELAAPPPSVDVPEPEGRVKEH